jgi:hypothetical protein
MASMVEEITRVKHSWRGYRASVSGQGVPPARAEWFVRWAPRFARAVPGEPLRARTGAHVRGFLRDLETQAHAEPWQVEQAQEALRMLYQERLPLPWARPWPSEIRTRSRPGDWYSADPFVTRSAHVPSMRPTRRR